MEKVKDILGILLSILLGFFLFIIGPAAIYAACTYTNLDTCVRVFLCLFGLMSLSIDGCIIIAILSQPIEHYYD